MAMQQEAVESLRHSLQSLQLQEAVRLHHRARFLTKKEAKAADAEELGAVDVEELPKKILAEAEPEAAVAVS